MPGSKIKYIVLGVVAMASCHSPTKKEAVQTVANPAPVVIQKESTPIVNTPTASPGTYVILDTIIRRDTLKVVLYDKTMIRCSFNRLSAVLDARSEVRAWDSSYAICNCMLPPNKWKPVNLIMNDSLLIISTTCGYMAMDGATHIYLLYRTKKSLKFAKGKNPIAQYPCTMYVDLKNNTIMGYYYHEIYDDEPDAGEGQYGRWLVGRYKIINRSFVFMGTAAVYYPQYDEVDLDNDSTLRPFYKTVIQKENWKRDSYDSDNRQRITVVDTIVGRDTIKVEYDNLGNVVCRLNRLCDTTTWNQTWVGYEPWRNNDFKRIITPGKHTPCSFILTDSTLLFSIVNAGNTAALFLFNKRDTTLDTAYIGNHAEYIYADMKNNKFISYVGPYYRDYVYGTSDYVYNDSIHSIKEYRIKKGSFVKMHVSNNVVFRNASNSFPSSFSDYYDVYNSWAKYRRIHPKAK